MDQFEGWASIIAALGVGTILLEGSKALFRWGSGRVGRERDAVTYERKLRVEADQRALAEQARADALDDKLDREIALRRDITRIAGRYEHRLVVLGADPATLETWPVETTVPRQTLPALGGERSEER